MKRTFISISLLSFICLSYCTKKDSPAPNTNGPALNTGTFSFDGRSYSGSCLPSDEFGFALACIAPEPSPNFVAYAIYFETKPLVSKLYRVAKFFPLDSNSASISVTDSIDGHVNKWLTYDTTQSQKIIVQVFSDRYSVSFTGINIKAFANNSFGRSTTLSGIMSLSKN